MDWSLQELLNGLASKCYRLFSAERAERGDAGAQFEKLRKPSYYCLRHTYATFRLYADVPIDKLAKNMGCSVKFIEDHYGHVQPMRISKTLTQNWKKDESNKFIMEL